MSPATASATTATRAGAAVPPAQRNPLPAPSPTRTTPPLRVVRPRATPPRAPFVLLVSVLLGGGLVMVLLVNTWLAQGSFTVHGLTIDQSKYADEEQALTQSIAARAAPQALAAHAVALGMVPAPNPVFRRASDGSVLGAPTVAWAPPPPVVAQPSASPSASSSPSSSPSASPSAAPSPSTSAPSASPSGSPAPAATPAATKPAAAPAGAKPTAAPAGAKPTATAVAKPTATAVAKSPAAGAAKPTATAAGAKPTATPGSRP